MKNILIVDDEKSICQSLKGILEDEGFQTSFAATGEKCLEIIQEENPDLILLDIWMPGIDGLETLKKVKQIRPQQLVIMMSGHGSIETAVKATRLGAFDFIEKPLSLEKVLLSIQNAIKISQLVAENKALKEKIGRDYQMIGESPVIDQLKQQIKLAAPSSGWVLITGENGTGKELVARAIHQQSKRTDKPFIEVNCAAIPEELIESELFGHEKGAFTGATAARKGKFDQANGGTLFLDEIGDMSLKTQAKILRILQEHKFERVGGNKTIEVDVRVIAATNKDLQTEIQIGSFREDLFFRLNVLPFSVPPLRQRKDDIPRLCRHFLQYFCSKESREIKTISETALKALLNYNWPGNVRELKNLIERLVIMTPAQEIKLTDLPHGINILISSESKEQAYRPEELPDSYREAKEIFEKQFLIEKLKKNKWNVSRTAEEIGLERSNLHRKIKSYQIEPS
ncbi:MAG: sigma-54 dependent transcriptional regulator [Deltaproteobacteria bacterium]|jgi:two-component system nitrogen regulation response regulator NtrX|nr:sigma-54 dependent transcriptional regulator [Deltaproteobacteria bacterium]MCW9049600.1 sigma-54 dependent transcriptional regulator [Deltaproteobacteria bacterium]